MLFNEKNKRSINFAIVGFGGIARTHSIGAYSANLIWSLPYNLNLSAIVTRRPVNSVINGVKYTQNLKEVLEDPNIDFIDVCTPNDSHGEIVNEAAKFKKPIYCEKPLSSSYEEAEEMLKTVERLKVQNSCALIYRFMPSIRLLKQEVENGTIGEIIDFKTKLYHKSYLDPNKKGAWRTKASSGGGALLDLGIHLIDIIHFTLGQTEKVKCSTDIFFKDRTSVDEMANCEIYLENGVKGSLEVSRIFANSLEPTTFTVYGTKGSLKMTSQRPHVLEIYDYNKDITCIKSAKQLEKILDYYPNERNSLGFAQDCHMASIVNFSNLILRETAENSITPTFKEALDAQKVVEAAYESNKSSRWVNIEEI